MKPTYESPLASRYASKTMLHLFSPDMRYETWRRLWVALARAEHTLGLPITQAQVDELAAHVSPIDYDVVAAREKEVRHDVMAHIYAYGLDAPGAKGVIHLGATSCYVTDNADLILYREALRYLERELKAAMRNLCEFANRYAAMPALAYTHYQPAQLTTIGKRASLWLQDLMLDLEEVQDTLRAFRFLGCRGTTGTEASFVELFDGDMAKIDEMNRQIAAEFGFSRCYPVCGQTYPRKLDSRILNALSSICQSACRMATDIRLLQHDRQVEEPFEDKQIGSSAMPYKRNPMRCERICSLARYVIADAQNAPMTAMTQWLERTLDDSANRRISLPEAFLATDSVLRLVQNVTKGLHVNEKIVEKLRKTQKVDEKKAFQETRKDIPNIASMDQAEAAALIAENPAYGTVICRCEKVTEGEIIDAIRRPLGARSLDGIKRRTRAGMGRCQAGFCSTKVMEILARELGIPLEEVTKAGGDSRMLTGGER